MRNLQIFRMIKILALSNNNNLKKKLWDDKKVNLDLQWYPQTSNNARRICFIPHISHVFWHLEKI